ncbi:LamG domain-containing protein [Saccharothrix deserti]|uniref:LamG domain-containing protein n=1 Tax=Saccharothrix deserti TaxID=2593674 RepID=UPI00131B18A7|nr:LamG domain-containing protein [Saccharothrix deserti]
MSEDKWANYGASGTGEVTAPRPVDLRTDRSYSVSAWVRLDTADTSARVAVSLGDPQFPPFLLHYRPENRQWGFLMTHRPDSSAWWIALSDSQVQTGQWVHLVGTYDAVAGRIGLYVNGVKQTRNFSQTPDGGGVTGWNGTGPLWIGRGLWVGQKANPWKGDVDDVRVYSGVLTPEQVSTLRFDTLHF